jgi:hypothetical protein
MKALVLFLLLAQAAGEVLLSGRVVDSVTQQPVTGALVQYQGADAVTDAGGAWSLNVKPFVSNRELMISKKGYSQFRQYFTLRSGGSETHDFELSPSAHLSGHIVDRDSGKPISGVAATLRGNGGMFYANPSGADGSFFITGDLPPGSFVLEVHPFSQVRFVAGKEKPEPPGYGKTWYPAATRADAAAPVTLMAGEKREIEMKLRKRELRHISAAVEAPEGRENEPISISLYSHDGAALLRNDLPASGAFRIEGLDDGSYELKAEFPLMRFPSDSGAFTLLPPKDRAFAISPVEIAGRDIEDLKLTMRPGLSIRAVVTVAEKDVPVPKSIGFSLRGMPASPAHAVSPVGYGVASDRLRPEGFPAGEYWAWLGKPVGWAITSVSYNGVDILHTPIDVEASESTVYVTITSRPGMIAGIVRDADQKPVDGAAVALLPQPLPATMDTFDPTALTVQEADPSGRFRFSGLAPGKYKAVALTGPDRERAHDLAFLRDRMSYSGLIDLDFGQTATVELHVP